LRGARAATLRACSIFRFLVGQWVCTCGTATRLVRHQTQIPLPYPTFGPARNATFVRTIQGRQMKLVPFERFMELANSLQRNNPFHVQRAVFVSTEDPAVILQTQSEAVMGDWSTLTYSMPRFNDYNGPADQLNKLSSKISPGRLTRLHILQVRTSSAVLVPQRFHSCRFSAIVRSCSWRWNVTRGLGRFYRTGTGTVCSGSEASVPFRDSSSYFL
jgi:hypothetical protein